MSDHDSMKAHQTQTRLTQKRVFDLALSFVLLPVLLPPMALIAIVIKLTSRDDIIYWSERVGRNGVVFRMPKFRTIKSGSASADAEPSFHLGCLGKFLRYSSLDELPQLFSIVTGHMSFVGPRPIMPKEDDIISLRAQKGIEALLPGLTGWAQINGRDELTTTEKVEFDLEYMHTQSLWLDIKILCITVVKVIKRDGVVH